MKDKSKKVIIAFISTVLIFILQTVDVLFIHSQGSLFGGNIIARIAGLVVAVIVSRLLHFNIKNFTYQRYGSFFEILIGSVYALIPVAVFYGIEYLALVIKGGSQIGLYVSFPNTNDDMHIKGRILAVGLYVVTVLIESIFKEVFFRGFLITQLFDKFKFQNSNFIQSFLYMLLTIPMIIVYFRNGVFEYLGWQMTTLIIVGTLLTDFISGYKWGLFYRVNGTIWMSTADHFVYNLVFTCVSVTVTPLHSKWYILMALLVQLASLCLFLPMYFSRDRVNEEIAAEVAIQRELAGLPVDTYSPSPMRHFIDERRFKKQEEFAKKNNLPVPKPVTHTPNVFEEPLSLKETLNVLSDKPAKKGGSQGILSDTLEDRAGAVKEYFGEIVEKSHHGENAIQDAEKNAMGKLVDNSTEDDVEYDESTSAGNISKLVQGYFQNDFDKHTFNRQ